MVAVAIDGPAGAGKSTIAKRVAEKLGFIYVDTGAMYRAVGLYMLENGVLQKGSGCICAALNEISVSIAFASGVQRVMLCGRDVTDSLRSESVSMAASNVSSIPAVRSFLLDSQRGIAAENNVVMDGRDIGTVVLPDAEVKIFLTASPEERAKRRYDELLSKGEKADYQSVLSDLKKRDMNDTTRAAAPLAQAEDAVRIDTTGNTLGQSVAVVLDAVGKRLESLGR
ncbi:MAG TPA: (d)CMP kinase [Ruminococcaceae bacterium]|nr:(d)CMP kinase [Oscillospiraceae bacterium]